MKETLKVFSIASKSFVKKMFFSLILFDSLNGLCRKGKNARILDDVFCMCNTFEVFLAKIKLSSFSKLQSFAKKSFHVTDVQNL